MGADSAGGGITGGSVDRWGCSREGMQRHAGDPLRLQAADALHGEIRRYVDFVKSSRTVTPNGEILIPGDIERRTRNQRL